MQSKIKNFQHHYSTLQLQSFRNHHNMLICCSRNIYYYYYYQW